jgi:hypothetical protein
MQKIFLKSSIIFLIIFLSIQICISQSNNNINRQYRNIFKKAAIDNKFPKAFVKLDSLYDDFYENQYPVLLKNSTLGQYFKKMDDQTLIEYARIFLNIKYFPQDYVLNYFTLANAPFDDQRKREKHSKKIHSNFEEILLIKPGAFSNNIRKKIFSRLDWEWEFHFQNKYILLVKVIDKQRGVPGKIENIPFYTCELIQDIKGNFKGPEQIKLLGNFVKGAMNINSEYLILVWGECVINLKLTGTYLLRGLATDDEAFFVFENGIIKDPNYRLHFGKAEILIEDYYESIQNFIHNIAGVPYYEN